MTEEFWTVFVEKRRDRIPSKDLVKQMTADDLSIWHDYGRGHSITQREVAALLRKLQIYPRGIAAANAGSRVTTPTTFSKSRFSSESWVAIRSCAPNRR